MPRLRAARPEQSHALRDAGFTRSRAGSWCFPGRSTTALRPADRLHRLRRASTADEIKRPSNGASPCESLRDELRLA